MSRTEIGTVRMSYTMQPCGRDGRPINGGNHYANADTIERAREYARNVLSENTFLGFVVRSVTIDGRNYRFSGAAWSPVNDGSYVHERIESELPYPYTTADLAMECYETTVMDYFEVVHERRSDGTCKCGQS